MTVYHPTILRLLPILVLAAVVLGPMAYWGMTALEPETQFAGAISGACLVAIYALAVRHVCLPVIVLDGYTAQTRTLLSRTRKIADLRMYQLVISVDFIAFRQADTQDIMLDRADFTPKQWQALLADLRQVTDDMKI